jgi:hypothetical protein
LILKSAHARCEQLLHKLYKPSKTLEILEMLITKLLHHIGYPTIKHFPAGPKSGEPQEYDGGRTSDDIVSWALGKHVVNIPAPELVQITKQSNIQDECEQK